MWKEHIYNVTLIPHIDDDGETNNNFNNDNKNTSVPLVFLLLLLFCLVDFLHAVNITDCGFVKSGSWGFSLPKLVWIFFSGSHLQYKHHPTVSCVVLLCDRLLGSYKAGQLVLDTLYFLPQRLTGDFAKEGSGCGIPHAGDEAQGLWMLRAYFAPLPESHPTPQPSFFF